jgi:hypothetical protein
MATHRELRQRVSRRLNQALVTVNKGGAVGNVEDIPRTNVFWTRQEVTDWLNEWLLDFYVEIALIEPETLIVETDGTYTASSRSVSLQTILGIADDPLRVEEIRNVTGATDGIGTLLWYNPQRALRRYSADGATSNYPNMGSYRWTWFGNAPMRGRIWPTPSGAMTVRVMYIPAQPLNATSGTAPALRPDTADNGTGDGDVPVWIPTALHMLGVEYSVMRAFQKEENPSWQASAALYEEKKQRFFAAVNERQGQDARDTFITAPQDLVFGQSRRRR